MHLHSWSQTFGNDCIYIFAANWYQIFSSLPFAATADFAILKTMLP